MSGNEAWYIAIFVRGTSEEYADGFHVFRVVDWGSRRLKVEYVGWMSVRELARFASHGRRVDMLFPGLHLAKDITLVGMAKEEE